jgi:hypothetical protein
MAELSAVLEALKQNNEVMEAIEGELVDIKVEIGNLPEKYLPRDEAKDKAKRIKEIAVAGMGGLLALLLMGAGFTVYVKNEAVGACREGRTALRQVIEIAVADRQPLSSSTPETIAAIEDANQRLVRPLRERLLSLDGTQPEKC